LLQPIERNLHVSLVYLGAKIGGLFGILVIRTGGMFKSWF
jgi:hypothetical protein